MNSSLAATGASYPWLHSKRCSVSEPGMSPRHMSRYVALPTSLNQADPTYWGLLKQPDKQKVTNLTCRRIPWHKFVCSQND
jgi:hypothetical protein